jgi:hypothetical protein
MINRFKQPHEPPVTLQTLVERLQRLVAPGSEIVLVDERAKLPNLDRWIVGAAGEQFSPIEVWLPAKEHDHVFAALGRIWKPIWGAGDTDRALPGAVVSWSIVCTFGPLPLRIWTRRGLVLSIDATSVRGIATAGRNHAISEVIGAEDVELLWGLRRACILRLTNGANLEIAAKWIPIRILGPLGVAMTGIDYDEESCDLGDAIISLLRQRINNALSRAREAGRK